MAVLSCSDVYQKKVDGSMACYVFGDKTKKDAIENNVYYPAAKYND